MGGERGDLEASRTRLVSDGGVGAVLPLPLALASPQPQAFSLAGLRSWLEQLRLCKVGSGV